MRVRTAVPEDVTAIAAVHIASWRTTYRGLLPEEVLCNLSLAQREAQKRRQIEAVENAPDHGGVFVAESHRTA